MKALQPGGPLLGVMPRSALDVALEPEAFREAKAVGLGGGGLVFLDDSACIVDLCAQFEWFLEDESCGRCTACREVAPGAVRVVDAFGPEAAIARDEPLAVTAGG